MKLNSGTMFKEEIEGKRRRSRGQEMEGIESVDEERKGKDEGRQVVETVECGELDT